MSKKPVLGVSILLMLVMAFQSGSAQKRTPRIDAFLGMAEKATSLEPLATWFAKQKYTDAEKRALIDLVKSSPLGKKLDTLYGNSSRKAERESLARINTIRQQAKSDSARKRTQQLANYRTRAASLLSAAGKVPVRQPFKTMAMPTDLTRMGTARPSGPQAEIDELDPAPPLVVGRRFNVIGRNFGTTRGRVVLLMAALSDHGRPDILDCRVDRWGNELIQVTIPGLADAWLDGREKTGVIWVKLAGGETGPLREARIAPDYSLIVPEIARVSAETIEPGAVLTITGENFCASPKGTVTFHLSDCGETFNGEVELWSDTAIRVVLPADIEGVHPQRCRLEITNHLGNKRGRTIDFEPIWLVETLYVQHSFEHRLTNFLRMFFGETGTFTDHDIRLINGWRVVQSYIRYDGDGNYGAEHRAHPSEGDTYCASTVFVWCDGFARVACANCVEITGPKGFPYQ